MAMLRKNSTPQQQVEDWKFSTKGQTEEALSFELDKLLKTAPENDHAVWQLEIEGYKSLFGKFLRAKAEIDWDKINPLHPEAVKPYEMLTEPGADEMREMLNQLVVVKLNGGLGTSMGCKGPKSLIPVRHELTFFDLTMQQISQLNQNYGVSVPLVLMNSFNTDEDTLKVLKKYKNIRVEVLSFNQSRFPRINKETFMPITKSLQSNDNEAWYPPGHGNFYEAFYNSGLLEKFVLQGKKYCFVSNIDNLGATVDANIMSLLMNPQTTHNFVMELTDKTRADVKGGTLVQYEDRLMLLEIAQVPKDHVDEFKSVSKFKIFNTNNLWCNLEEVKRLVSEKQMNMEVIVNPKHLDNGLDVIQLETAAGAAIRNFTGAVGVNVPRSRFLPVKKTQDLLLVMSNLYELQQGTLGLSHLRSFPTTPLVKLGSSFDKVQHFLQRFQGIPDLLELDHLTVSGDVCFGKAVTLKGTVIIIANHGDRIDIPSGSILENKIVSGNLRILDH